MRLRRAVLLIFPRYYLSIDGQKTWPLRRSDSRRGDTPHLSLRKNRFRQPALRPHLMKAVELFFGRWSPAPRPGPRRGGGFRRCPGARASWRRRRQIPNATNRMYTPISNHCLGFPLPAPILKRFDSATVWPPSADAAGVRTAALISFGARDRTPLQCCDAVPATLRRIAASRTGRRLRGSR